MSQKKYPARVDMYTSIRLDNWAKKIIPSHLDSQELIANSWNNCEGVEDKVSCFKSTVEMFIDQNCSTF